MTWNDIADRALAGEVIEKDVARATLRADDSEILELLAAAFRLRQRFFGKTVKLNYLVNAQSGACPEDCGYCSQASNSQAEIDRYTMVTQDELVAASDRAVSLRATTCCIVASGRNANPNHVQLVADAAKEIKRRHPGLRLCACLGFLDQGLADVLHDAGIERYNHNLNTSQDHYSSICSTHTFDDRIDTVKKTVKSGMSPCSGLIVGMGESHDDLVDTVLALRELSVDSIPVNFLIPIEGTALTNTGVLTPRFCLRVLCMVRFLCPSREIRVSAGREHHIRSLQPLSLYAANALFVADYLTTKGQSPTLDWQMIEDLGFEVEAPEVFEPQPLVSSMGESGTHD